MMRIKYRVNSVMFCLFLYFFFVVVIVAKDALNKTEKLINPERQFFTHHHSLTASVNPQAHNTKPFHYLARSLM